MVFYSQLKYQINSLARNNKMIDLKYYKLIGTMKKIKKFYSVYKYANYKIWDNKITPLEIIRRKFHQA